MLKYWIILSVAILLEVFGTVYMKLSDGFTKLWPSIFIFVFYAASFVALTFAIKKIEISVAYAEIRQHLSDRRRCYRVEV